MALATANPRKGDGGRHLRQKPLCLDADTRTEVNKIKPPSPEKLYERSRESASELRKLLVSLSTGVVAVCFIALTADIAPPLTNIQKITLGITIVLMGLCAASGLVQWRADVKRNYYWAKALESEGNEKRDFYAERDNWLKIRRHSGQIMRSCFVVGVVLAVGYLFERIWSI